MEPNSINQVLSKAELHSETIKYLMHSKKNLKEADVVIGKIKNEINLFSGELRDMDPSIKKNEKEFKLLNSIIDEVSQEIKKDGRFEIELKNLEKIASTFKKEIGGVSDEAVEVPFSDAKMQEDAVKARLETTAFRSLPKALNPARNDEITKKMSVLQKIIDSSGLNYDLSQLINDPSFDEHLLRRYPNLNQLHYKISQVYNKSEGSLLNPMNWFRSLCSFFGVGELGKLRTLKNKVEIAKKLRSEDAVSKQDLKNLTAEQFQNKIKKGVDIPKDVFCEAANKEEYASHFKNMLAENFGNLNEDIIEYFAIAARSQPSDVFKELIPFFDKELYKYAFLLEENIVMIVLEQDHGADLMKAMTEHFGKYILIQADRGIQAPLHLVAKDPKYSNVFKGLIENTPPEILKEPNNDGLSALDLAMVHYNDLDILKSLLGKGGGGSGLVHLALNKQSIDNFKALIPELPKASFSYQNVHGNTPLQVAVELNKSIDILKAMIEQGGEDCLNVVNKKGQTILDLAIEKGDYVLIEELLKVKGQNLNQSQAKAIFQYAIENVDLDLYVMAKKVLGFEDYDQAIGNPKEKECLIIDESIIMNCFENVRKKLNNSEIDKVEYEDKVFDFLKDINNFTKSQYSMRLWDNKTSSMYTSVRERSFLSKLTDFYPPPVEFIQKMLEAGADPYIRDFEGDSVIDWIMRKKSRRAEFLPHVKHLKDSYDSR